MSPIRMLRDDELDAPVETSLPTSISPGSSGPYGVGDVVVLTSNFSDPTNTTPPVDANGFTLVNPSGVVSCRILKPDKSVVTVTATVSGFIYTASVTIDQAGTWWYRFYSGAGTFQGVAETFFQVAQQRTA